jgi:Na+/proline symporter
VIVYTVAGGSKAVSYTHLQQMSIIFIGMFLAGFMIVKLLPPDVSMIDATKIAGKLGKMNIIDLEFDMSNKYNLWSGLIGGMFLALSYFGTDQSQVSRYISAKDLKESRMGLLMNGIIKVPMQFAILFIGVLLFVFYQFNQSPLFFNNNEIEQLKNTPLANELVVLENQHQALFEKRKQEISLLNASIKSENETAISEHTNTIKSLIKEEDKVRADLSSLMEKRSDKSETNDTNYVFLRFVLDYLPHGLIGLLIAVIFAASMQSKSAELNSLASSSVVDIYKRMFNKNASDEHYLWVSKLGTALWGLYAVGVAMFANKLGSLIEAVNVLGSLFYGSILGVFLTAFFLKKVQGHAVFYAALIAESIVLYMYFFTDITFLWFNFIGAFLVMIFGILLQIFIKQKVVPVNIY